jgi:glycosyltransferase involved in cell wall biosynthesis
MNLFISKKRNTKMLMVYIEPTPYIVGLINALNWDGHVDVVFLEENKSQSWNISLNDRWFILPIKRKYKIRFIIRLLFTNKYDLIHVAGWGEPFCLFFIILAKLARIPVVVESDTQHPYRIKLWKRIIKRLFYPPLFSLINLFLAGGTRQAKYIEYYSVKSERIMCAQMTVDVVGIKKFIQTLSEYDRKKTRDHFNIPDEHVVFLFVGRLEIAKGIMDLVSAFSQCKYDKTTLLIVGDGSMRQRIEDNASSNITICYAGRLSGDDLMKIYYAADVVVLPSHSDSWGLVINEAMAVGRPVIVSDRTGCIDDLVIHQETGLIVKAECVDELQHAIEYMIKNTHERAGMERRTVQLIENWTLENEAENICKAWIKLIAEMKVGLS